MKIRLLFLIPFFAFVFGISCTNRGSVQAEIAQISVDELTAVQAIREIINIVGFVELPFKICSRRPTHTIDVAELVLKIGVHPHLYGILPDTTHFFGVLYLVPAGGGHPRLATFDKNGNLIDRQYILREKCHKIAGESVFCEEYVIINKDLTILYRYRSKHIWDRGFYQLECKHIERQGRIDQTGRIIFDEFVEFPIEDCITWSISKNDNPRTGYISDKNNPYSILYAFLRFEEWQSLHFRTVEIDMSRARMIVDSLAVNGGLRIFYVTNDTNLIPFEWGLESIGERRFGDIQNFRDDYLRIWVRTFSLDTVNNEIAFQGHFAKGLEEEENNMFFFTHRFVYPFYITDINGTFKYNSNAECPKERFVIIR